MDQHVETNGCEDGPASLPVRNHTEAPQSSKSDRQATKQMPQNASEGRTVRQSSSGSSGGRSRKQTNAVSSPPLLSPPHSHERRSTRHYPTLQPQNASNPPPLERRPSKSGFQTLVNKRSSASTSASSSAASPLVPPISLHIVNSTEGSNAKQIKHQIAPLSLVVTSQSAERKRRKGSSPLQPEPLSPRASKRIRLQYQPFQSPVPVGVIPVTLLRAPISKLPEDKIVVFNKGEFLAVRNETGNFYVCRTAQNVYKSSKRFKIQWMNDENEPDIYSADFYDHTDFECVLTNLRMRRVDKNKYLLPSDERKRTQNILQRALNVENGMDIPDPRQLTMDGVDVSIVGKEEEEDVVMTPNTRLGLPRKSPQRARGRPRKMEEAGESSPRSLRSSDGGKKKPKVLATKLKIQSRETNKVGIKVKQVQSREIASRKRKLLAQLTDRGKQLLATERLHPNTKVPLYDLDPTFETNTVIPFVSTSAHSRLLIRAVLLKDFKMLKTLLTDTEHICDLTAPRSVDMPLSALHYGIRNEDHRAIRALLTADKKKYASRPEIILPQQTTGSYCYQTLGFHVRPITASRGSREGNNAFLRDSDWYELNFPDVTDGMIRDALAAGVSLNTINLLCGEENKSSINASVQYATRDTVYRNIVSAVRGGHFKLVGALVDEAVQHGGYGFGFLHREVLGSYKQPLSKFKRASVVKKCIENARITPLHCAAINPNPQYLADMLSIVPEYSLQDKDMWRPIHYAAVCQGVGPLEILLSRSVPIHEVDSEGNSPLHSACIAGRAHNVDLLLRHAANMMLGHGKKGAEGNLNVAETFAVGIVDRPNRKSFTPLHLASQRGHMEVIKVLLTHKADVEKSTNANQEKLTAVMMAAQQGHLNVVKLLVQHSAKLETKDRRQRTALTHAVINGHAHVASYLLRLGANPNTQDSSGNTLAHYAAAYGWYFCLKLLMDAGADLNLANDWKLTPLSIAFMKGHMGLVDFLMEQKGIDISVNIHDENGITLVMQAVRTEPNASLLERVKFLVEKQHADCTKCDYHGNNSLHHMVLGEMEYQRRQDKDDTEKQKDHEVVLQHMARLLLNHGCDPKVKNKEGESPFSLAVKQGSLLLVKMFLDAGCQLAAEANAEGETLLHNLVNYVKDYDVKPLLQALLQTSGDGGEQSRQVLKAMTSMYDNKGHTPLLRALIALSSSTSKDRSTRLYDFVRFLVEDLEADVKLPAVQAKNEKDVYMNTALHLAVKCQGGKATELILAHGPVLDLPGPKGQTALILAIKAGNTAAAEAVIKAGADVNMESPEDNNLTPLLMASEKTNMGKLVQLLIQHKAAVHSTHPITGDTALHYIASLHPPDGVETVRALVEAGANINAVNTKLRTALHLAVNAQTGGTDASTALEDYLLQKGARTDICDCRGRIPLHYAFVKIKKHTDKSYSDPIELVALLTSAMGSHSVELVDNYGQTPLHRATYRGATISAMHLGQRMKNWDLRDQNGNTPLGLAVYGGHEGCTVMLLQKGTSCITDLVISPEMTSSKSTKRGRSGWRWQHLIPPPVQPVCHTILQEAVKKDWQGVLYLMLDQLEALGRGLTLAIEAALRTWRYNLALKLISRVKHGWTLYSEKQTMLQLLAREAPSDQHMDLQVKVAQALIDKGVPVMSRDEHGSSVLTYAAMNWNHTLCQFFTDKMGTMAVVQADPDKSLRTPFSALFWKLGSTDLPSGIRAWLVSLLQAGASPNLLTRYPLTESPFPGVGFINNGKLHEEDGSALKLSPLIVAIYQKNYAVARLLLNNKADPNFSDEQERSPLMHAIRLNDIKMVKLLLNHSYDPAADKSPASAVPKTHFKFTSVVSLTQKDKNGWGIIHHAVAPFPEFTYDTTPLLHLLSDVGASLDATDTTGQTPLQLAMSRGAEAVVDVLQELMGVFPELRIKPVQPEFPSIADVTQSDGSKFNYKEDAALMLQRWENSKAGKTDKKLEPEPDVQSELKGKGKVVMDPDQEIPFDVLMTVVDINYGAYSLYNFYKMQIIQQTGKDLYILFTCWGRIGTLGQHQSTPFTQLPDAVKEFCKIFRSKSGNTWESVKTFQPQPKKYNLVHLDKWRSCKKEPFEFDLTSAISSKLPEPLPDLMSPLMDVHTLQTLPPQLGASDNTFPFGCLPEEALNKAESLLEAIQTLVKEKEEIGQDVKAQSRNAEILHKIVELSEQYYHLVPVHGHEYERLSPFFHASSLHDELELVSHLRHIALATEMLLGAQLRKEELCPADYVYRSLGCQLNLLDEASQESQLVLQYIHNTCTGTELSSRPKVEAIFKVTRFGEAHELNDCHLGNHTLLWHGTQASNLLGILARGLQMAPLGLGFPSPLFGKGIYLADSFAKSWKYCHTAGSGKSLYMLLCEVALGKVKDVELESDTEVNGYNCLRARGTWHPDPSLSVSWKGCVVPLAPLVQEVDEQDGRIRYHRLSFNEYVVQNPAQVCIRYLVQFEA